MRRASVGCAVMEVPAGNLADQGSHLGNAFRELPAHAQFHCAGATEVSTYVSVSLGG
jgi:hypothetical protein